MKLGLLVNLYRNKPFAEVLEIAKAKGIEAIEIGAGGWGGKEHCNPEELLKNKDEYLKFENTIKQSGMIVSAVSS